MNTLLSHTRKCITRRPNIRRDGAYVTDPVIGDGAAKYTPSISERRGSTTTFIHSGMKNADAQTNTGGTVSASRVYDAFGAELSSTGTWQGRFGYAGGFGYQEDDGGFKLLGHRYYDPSTGRFLTRDPAKDGRGWYAYCSSSPIISSDSSGLEWHDPVSVDIDISFRGKIWAVGELRKGEDQVFRQVLRGQTSPLGMDVDLLIVQDETGSQDRYFLPGINPPHDPRNIGSTYFVSERGVVHTGPMLEPRVAPYPITTQGPMIPIPLLVFRSRPFNPKRFGPKPGGGYPGWGMFGGGNWNDDIESAKRR